MNILRLSKFAAIVLPAVLLSASGAPAGDNRTVVKFKPGTSSSELAGRVRGYDTNTYILEARAGQTLKVSLKATHTSCYFNVNPPAGAEAIYNGSVSGFDFAGTLTADGNYTTMVYLMRNAARRNETCNYTVKFEIDG